MTKTFQMEYQIPLPMKITLVGLRIETGQAPSQTLQSNKILLEDEWKVQIIYVPYGQRQDATKPSLLEHIIKWRQELEQEKEFPQGTKLVYKKKVRSLSNNTRVAEDGKHFLDLLLEVTLDFEVMSDDIVPVQSAVQQSPFTYANLDGRLSKVEKATEEMQKAISLIQDRVTELENYAKSLRTGKLYGQILDSFRLIPIQKAVIEISQEDDQPVIKGASDNHGKYSLEYIPQGTYNIKVKHPRYLPLVVTGYKITENENKAQDFLMHRV